MANGMYNSGGYGNIEEPDYNTMTASIDGNSTWGEGADPFQIRKLQKAWRESDWSIQNYGDVFYSTGYKAGIQDYWDWIKSKTGGWQEDWGGLFSTDDIFDWLVEQGIKDINDANREQATKQNNKAHGPEPIKGDTINGESYKNGKLIKKYKLIRDENKNVVDTLK